MDESVRAEIVESWDAGFRYFLQRPGSSGYSNFCHKSLDLLKDQLQGPAFADGQVFTNANKPHEPGTQFVPWLDTYRPWLKLLQKEFVVTTADKLANNYVVVCKKHYIQRLLADLSSGQFYAEVPTATGQPDALHTAAQALFGRVTA